MAPPNSPVSIVWAVHQKGSNREHPGGWRGVLVGHWSNLDLVAVKKSTTQKPVPEVLGYVYDPAFNYQDIVLTEIEGRLLECNLTASEKLKGWRSRKGSPRTEGIKLSIMIDDQARHGSRPEYSKGELAFPVGFATWSINRDDWPQKGQDKQSPMLMRPIWRDNTSPLWGEWTDPDNVQCELLSMYFISEAGFKGLTQARPHYKFDHPQPKINLGIGGVSVTPNASSKMASSKMAAPQAKFADATTANVNTDDTSLPTEAVEPAEPKDIDQDLFAGETLKEVEEEMDAAPDGEPASVDSAVITNEQGQALVL